MTQLNDAYDQIGNLSVFVSLKSYNVVGDGVTDDSAELQRALDDAAGKTLFIHKPAVSYLHSQTLVVKGSGTRIIFESNYVNFKYTGNAEAILLPNCKHITLEFPTIDLTAAGSNAIGIRMAGSWYGTIYKPSISKNGANQIAILMETTATGYPGGINYGSFLNRIIELKTSGTGLYDIQAKQTAGDTMVHTHLTIDGGWVAGGSSGVYLEYVQSARVKMITPEQGNLTSGSAIYVGAGCSIVYLEEIGEMDGYAHGITVDGGALGVFIFGENNNGSVSDVNIVNGQVNRIGRNVFRMNAATNYFAEWYMNNNYANPVRLNVKGGGNNGGDIIKWDDSNGLYLYGGGFDIIPIRIDSPLQITRKCAPSNITKANTVFVDSTGDKRLKFKDDALNMTLISTCLQSSSAVATATGGTIATNAGISVSRVSPAAAVTGVILQAGTFGGQEITVINEATSANSVTFAASSSNVADGSSDVIAGGTARKFVWDSGTSLWYRLQ